MDRCDALIVGGGPAGSTCARVLQQAGWRVVVIDRASFPRDKVCAGWVTPGVFRLLDLNPVDYRATGLTIQEITGFRTSVIGAAPIETRYDHTISYAIRRCEFDTFLLHRSGADVRQGTPLQSLERRGDQWVANGEITAPIVVGAGGHFCPVARRLGTSPPMPSRPDAPPVRPVVAKEAEFQIEGEDTTANGLVPELFFCRDLEGYGWCVRKGRYLNIGMGRRDHGDLNAHVEAFQTMLARAGLARRATLVRWHGHAYLASGTGGRPLTGDGVLLVGDAAGLAYPESGEGIKPAVESGRLAAETLIATGNPATREALDAYDAQIRRGHPASPPLPPVLAGLSRTLGRMLMRSPLFTQHILIDRWFLRS